jgi:hypothetical protein
MIQIRHKNMSVPEFAILLCHFGAGPIVGLAATGAPARHLWLPSLNVSAEAVEGELAVVHGGVVKVLKGAIVVRGDAVAQQHRHDERQDLDQ